MLNLNEVAASVGEEIGKLLTLYRSITGEEYSAGGTKRRGRAAKKAGVKRGRRKNAKKATGKRRGRPKGSKNAKKATAKKGAKKTGRKRAAKAPSSALPGVGSARGTEGA